jgi:hypothetical protein
MDWAETVTGSCYAFRVTGRLSERVRDAFPTMEVVEIPAETVISGALDEEQVHEVLDRIQELGLHVISIERLTP